MILRFSAFASSTLALFHLVAGAAAATPVADLDWESLAKSLASSDSLQVLLEDGPKVWEQQCTVPYAEEGYPYMVPAGAAELVNHSHWQLVDQPAGLCSHGLSCVFKHCDWAPKPFSQINSELEDKVDPLAPLASLQDYVDYEGVPKESWNLPAAVLFPTAASDVVNAVKFAASNEIGMSVKTTGHSWTGSGMDKDSLLINMRKYPKYLAQDGYLMECHDVSEDPSAVSDRDAADGGGLLTTTQLREQACRVAKARGWSAIMRVGGGNLWDEAYRSVSDWNRERSSSNGSGNWTYHIVGGSAGTVGAAGGWMLQTGLSGNTGMRRFGFGVDQVTQLEMVLPTGQHVRFGPTKWQEDENLAFPRTSEVTGWCNKDPSLPEEEWKWQVCGDEDNINVSFDDLWHANRGGGGGFGIILSIEYQLPDWPGTLGYLDLVLSEDVTNFNAANPSALFPFLSSFLMDALWNPEAVGLSEDESSLCGLPYFVPGTFGLSCFGRGGHAYAAAFKAQVENQKESLMGLGLSEDQVSSLGNSLTPNARGEFNDYVEQGLEGEATETGGIPGRLSSYPKPMVSFVTGPITMSSLVSRDFVNSDEGRTMITGFGPKLGQYLLGANTAKYHDGTTATSQAYREAAFWDMITEIPGYSYPPSDFLSFSLGDGTPQDSFPPMGGSYNHLSDSHVGPTKANWTKLCPPLSENFTRADRKESCVDPLEFIFGTDGLARLEAIKEAADPNHLFNCYACVGYRETESGQGEETIFVSSGNEETASSSTSYQQGTTFALVAFFAGLSGFFNVVV